MVAPLLNSCASGCGWIAAILSACSYGSFGVPIKLATGSIPNKIDAGCFGGCIPDSFSGEGDSKDSSNKKVEIHGLVLQSYKTLVCFVTSWLVPLLLDEEVKWSNWGLLSGLFWVPGAICGIYGIRNAGMAIAVGTWSSCNVLISFAFGMIVFQEEVKDIYQTGCAFMVLIAGLVGMSRYSSASAQDIDAKKQPLDAKQQKQQLLDAKQQQKELLDAKQPQSSPQSLNSRIKEKSSPQQLRSPSRELDISTMAGEDDVIRDSTQSKNMLPMEIEPLLNHVEEGNSSRTTKIKSSASSRPGSIIKKQVSPSGPKRVIDDQDIIKNQKYLRSTKQKQSSRIADDKNKDELYSAQKKRTKDPLFILWGGRIVLTKRQSGILGAFINGVWGGLALIPLHYARRDDPTLTPEGYLISFSGGALLVNIVMWVVFFAYVVHKKQCSVPDALAAVPKFHCHVIGIPGIIAGLLYSFGNFMAILSIALLGQGIGGSFIQLQILVSGLWGVFYFREVRGRESILKWFLSATTAVLAIVWLSYQQVATVTTSTTTTSTTTTDMTSLSPAVK